MSLDDLRVFLAVARLRSFTQASERLAMPKTSVSRAVARLETQLGGRLFERSTRSLRLTDAGAQLYDQTAQLAERLEDQLLGAVAQPDRPQGVLRIAAPYELGVMRLGDVLNDMLLRFPGLEAEIDLTSSQIDPRNDDYDIVFRVQTGPLPDSNQVARRLYSIERGLYAAPALVARYGVPRTPSELASWPAVMSPDEPVWQLQGPAGEIAELRLAGPLRAANVGMRLRAVAAGLGVGLLSATYSQEAVASGRILPLLPDYAIAPTRVYALLPGRRLMPAKVRYFLDALAEALAPWDNEAP
ncbi:MAG: LysR family transcriptional regulator [Paludibacterium sp.]|uniref:LysR family transcriptional regulator n=1 Tax=Paludibacterium sp. TaxID=1917523 RepID=UPI0025EC1E72|nr:LysR family transcriptional regulator [Paludibacterium sp.]MBV8046778.1 LysR family transcriptional regulator [Paludibacterium sp.]MBV8648922.1 LysR family transcriptional regulator [Paludibacterium sp.]